MVYIGNEKNLSTPIKDIYVGVNNQAQRIVVAYCGDENGKSKIVYQNRYTVVVENNVQQRTLYVRNILNSSTDWRIMPNNEALLKPKFSIEERKYELYIHKYYLLKPQPATEAIIHYLDGSRMALKASGTISIEGLTYGIFQFDNTVSTITITN